MTAARDLANVISSWRRYSDAYLRVTNKFDEATAGYPRTVGEYLADYADEMDLLDKRAAYLEWLVEAGILRNDEDVPEDDLLWEIYPTDLRVEIDNR